jgi:hypothetical protein
MDKGNDESNKKCAEVVFVRSPGYFWLRFDECKQKYLELIDNLQAEYSSVE